MKGFGSLTVISVIEYCKVNTKFIFWGEKFEMSI